ncbi:MAG: aromatic amino acid lyase, partial [Proteobacteria bacterium]|nr:aromatic amino acid lyase [Pseudomonadota bacterium]
KHLANPCTTDSTPTSANQEDHVSMAANAARRLDKMNVNLSTILGIEAMCAVEGIEFRHPLKTGKKLEPVIARFRKIVPALEQDRFLSKDIINASKMIGDGSLIIGMDLPTYSKEI